MKEVQKCFEWNLKLCTSKNVASVLAVVHVLLGRAVTEYRWGGSRNILFMRHKFLVLTVKNFLKSVYIYGSYRKIKTGLSLFWTTLYSRNRLLKRSKGSKRSSSAVAKKAARTAFAGTCWRWLIQTWKFWRFANFACWHYVLIYLSYRTNVYGQRSGVWDLGQCRWLKVAQLCSYSLVETLLLQDSRIVGYSARMYRLATIIHSVIERQTTISRRPTALRSANYLINGSYPT